MTGDFVFNSSAPINPAVSPYTSSTNSNNMAEIVFWQSIQTSKHSSDYNAYMRQYPNGVFFELALNRASDYAIVENVTSPVVITNVNERKKKSSTHSTKHTSAPRLAPKYQNNASNNDQRSDIAFWQAIRSSTNAKDFEDYLQRFPNGVYASIATAKLAPSNPNRENNSTVQLVKSPFHHKGVWSGSTNQCGTVPSSAEHAIFSAEVFATGD
ncbi:MAG: hypothetical protein HN608_11680, partial [Rhodospirillaceae bacterium]|nr:hypothetical protein [Rhodospirillaceae bacterium]